MDIFNRDLSNCQINSVYQSQNTNNSRVKFEINSNEPKYAYNDMFLPIESANNQTEQFHMVKEYFYKWMRVTRDKKKHHKNKQISQFLEKLLEEKEKVTNNKKDNHIVHVEDNDLDKSMNKINMYNSDKKNGCAALYGNYQHRFQAQKHIIALQKAKLEQQKRYIEELKLNRMVDDANSSINNITSVKNTINQCSLNIRPKLKCALSDVKNIESESEELLKVNCMKVPKFLQKMEQRAREREEKRAIVAERRRQIELEREQIKEQMQLEKQLMDQDERDRRLSEFKERRQREQLIAIQRKKFSDKIRALIVMADLHYEKKIILKYGISRWKLFVQKVKDDNVKALCFNKTRIIKSHFNRWRTVAVEIINERNVRAENLYNYKLTSRTFAIFKKEYKITINKLQTAEDWYETHLIDKVFIMWKITVYKLKVYNQKQWKLAIQHYESNLKWKIIGCWQTIPTINALEREQEARKQRWRAKVQQVLPDYIPRDIEH